MTYELVCDACGAILYAGFDLKFPKEILKPSGGKCKKCGAMLSLQDFRLEITKLAG